MQKTFITLLTLTLILAAACTDSNSLQGTWQQYNHPFKEGGVSFTFEIADDDTFLSYTTTSTNKGLITFDGSLLSLSMTHEMSNTQWVAVTPEEKMVLTAFVDKSIFSFLEVYTRESGSGISGTWKNFGSLYYDSVLFGAVETTFTTTTSNAYKIELMTAPGFTNYSTNWYYIQTINNLNYRVIKTNMTLTNYYTIFNDYLYEAGNEFYNANGDSGSFWLY